MTRIRAHRVVVGVDETPGSRAALTFAMCEAALRGSVLDVITAWTLTEEDHIAPGDDVCGHEMPERARRRAQQIQDRAVALTLQDIDARPLLSRQVLEGDAGKVLLRVARDAASLVVGSSTSEPLLPASLGSVRDYCVRHATCEVVVVQTPARRTGTHDAEGAHDASRQRTTSRSLP